jgi:hypothetical protein
MEEKRTVELTIDGNASYTCNYNTTGDFYRICERNESRSEQEPKCTIIGKVIDNMMYNETLL